MWFNILKHKWASSDPRGSVKSKELRWSQRGRENCIFERLVTLEISDLRGDVEGLSSNRQGSLMKTPFRLFASIFVSNCLWHLGGGCVKPGASEGVSPSMPPLSIYVLLKHLLNTPLIFSNHFLCDTFKFSICRKSLKMIELKTTSLK